IRMLAPYFTAENVEELISAATHRSKSDIERLIAQRFTPAQPLKTLDRIRAIPTKSVGAPVPERVDPLFQALNEEKTTNSPDPEPLLLEARGSTAAAAVASRPVASRAPIRFLFNCTLDEEALDMFRYLQTLYSNVIPTGNMEQVLKRVFRIAIEHE